MANLGGDAGVHIDDPLAELERLVNERTQRMARDTADLLVEPVTNVELPGFEDTLTASLDAALNETLASNEFEAQTYSEHMLPSLAALRGSVEASPNDEFNVSFDEFESELGDVVADAMAANSSALATLAAQPINDEVPPATHPVEVPELPNFDEQATFVPLSPEEFERELVDELVLIDGSEGAASGPLAGEGDVTTGAANDDRPTRRRGFLVAAMLGGVAVFGGAAAMTLGSGDEPLVVATVSADTKPHKVKPDEPAKVKTARVNPVYDRVATSAEAKAPKLPQTSLIESAEDVSDVRVAKAVASPKADDRLNPSAPSINVASIEADEALGPRRVRTLRVGPNGKLVDGAAVSSSAAKASTPAINSGANVAESVDVAAIPANVADASVSDADTASTPTAMEEGVPSPGTPLPRFRPTSARTASVETFVEQTVTAQDAADEPIAESQPGANASEWRVQIAAAPNGDAAREAYASANSRYGSVLGGRSVDYQVAEIEGRGTFHRVRIVAADRGDANSLCERLKQAGGSCFVTR